MLGKTPISLVTTGTAITAPVPYEASTYSIHIAIFCFVKRVYSVAACKNSTYFFFLSISISDFDFLIFQYNFLLIHSVQRLLFFLLIHVLEIETKINCKNCIWPCSKCFYFVFRIFN